MLVSTNVDGYNIKRGICHISQKIYNDHKDSSGEKEEISQISINIKACRRQAHI